MDDDKSDFQNGSDEMKEEGDAKNDHYEAGSDNADSYQAGWQAGHGMADPNNTMTPDQIKQKMHDDFEKLSPEERAAYRAGYGSGAARPQ